MIFQTSPKGENELRFEGYRYKFKLNASHSVLIGEQRGEIHSHTFEIRLDIRVDDDVFLDYKAFEKTVNQALDLYRGKYLNDISPFDKLEPTLENIGRVVCGAILDSMEKPDCLARMEISETPSRVYVITESEIQAIQNGKGMPETDRDVNSILIHDLQDITASELIDHYRDKPEPVKQEASILPQPEAVKPIALQGESKSVEPEIAQTQNKPLALVKIILSIAVVLSASVAFVLYLYRQGSYPWGSDTLGHIFRADLLYKDIKQGNYFPLYTNLWYNGIQPFRYWGPANYYILASFEFLTHGNAIRAFELFTGALFFIGAFGWILWGIKEKRMFLSVFIGILWFCLPDNLRVFFSEGNIPRCIITALFPFLLFFIWQYVEYGKKYALIPTILFMCIMIHCHLMISAMAGVTVAIFLFVFAIQTKKFKVSLQAVAALLLSFAVCGLWVFPALKGGLLSINSSVMFEDVMSTVASSFSKTLNPFLRFDNFEIYYFGLSIAFISVAGIFLAKKKSLPGFYTAVIILFGTNAALFPILARLPMNQLFWMYRYTPLAYGVFVVGLLQWKTLKKVLLVICVALLAADSFLSFLPLTHMVTPSAAMANSLEAAKSVTNQRIALLDESEFGSYPDYNIGSEGNITANAFGWASQGATTFSNDVMLNTALEARDYLYLFDRSIELGCDTIVVKKDKIPAQNESNLIGAGKKLQYSLYQSTGLVYIFHRSTPRQFGVISKYNGLAIGSTASNITLAFPCFEEGSSNNIEDYSYEKLSSYPYIFLSGFSYTNRKTAEALVSRLADNGVKIIIDMNSIPVDSITNRMTFLGVTAQTISFDENLPEMFYNGAMINCKKFDENNYHWNTVYLDNVPNPTGVAWIGNKKVVYFGQGQNKNISFLGFNLLYLGIVNKDSEAINLVGSAIQISSDKLPARTVVPIQIDSCPNQITIKSEYNGVNTTLANLDAFQSSRKLTGEHSLLFVDQGTTVIRLSYPYLGAGLLITAVGILGVVLLMIHISKEGRKHEKTS